MRVSHIAIPPTFKFKKRKRPPTTDSGKPLPKALIEYRAQAVLRPRKLKITLPPTPWDPKP